MRISYRPTPSIGVPNPPNQASLGNPIAASSPVRIPQSPPVARSFPGAAFHPFLPPPQPVPRSPPGKPSTPPAETLPSLPVHSLFPCPPLLPSPLPSLAPPPPFLPP